MKKSSTKNDRKKEINHSFADSYAKLEPDAKRVALGKKEGPRFTSPVRITITHYRKRLIDYDNLCTKGVVDQIVRLGILADDSPEFVKEIRHTQVKAEKEQTVIEIEEI